MTSDDLLTQILIPLVPCAVLCALFYKYIIEEKKITILKEKSKQLHQIQKQTLPIQLQAYERLTLFLERTQYNVLIERISASNDNDFKTYAHLLSEHIKQEFEHNITQQIYVSAPCWKAVVMAKNTSIAQLHLLTQKDTIKSVTDFQNELFSFINEKKNANTLALEIIQQEVQEILC